MNHCTLNDEILGHFEGVQKNDLNIILHDLDESGEDRPAFTPSNYLDTDTLNDFIRDKKKQFSILNLNIQGLIHNITKPGLPL